MNEVSLSDIYNALQVLIAGNGILCGLAFGSLLRGKFFG